MAGEWHRLRLGDVCKKIGSGSTPRGGSSVYLDQGNVALIRSQNVHNSGFRRDGLVYLTAEHAAELSNVEVEKADILLNITGDSVARSCQVAPDVLPARVNQHVAIIRTDPKVLWPRFLRYFLVSPQMQAEMLGLAGAGATRNALTKGMIESFKIAAPEDVEEQRALADILGMLDDKIELNRRINETLEAIARAIFKSWFVDFDPVRAKASGDPPASICRRLGLTPDLLALFPDRLVDSELGEIPYGWTVRPLSQLAEKISKGTTPTKQDIASSIDAASVPFIKVKDIDDRGEILRDDLELIPESVSNGALKRSILVTDDILFSIAGTIGRVAVVEPDLAASNTNQAVAFVRLKDIAAHLGLCFQHLQSNRIQEVANASVVQAVQANVSLASLGSFKIIVPNAEVLGLWNQAFGGFFSRKRICSAESRTLASMRDALIPKLLSGELCVLGGV